MRYQLKSIMPYTVATYSVTNNHSSITSLCMTQQIIYAWPIVGDGANILLDMQLTLAVQFPAYVTPSLRYA